MARRRVAVGREDDNIFGAESLATQLAYRVVEQPRLLIACAVGSHLYGTLVSFSTAESTAQPGSSTGLFCPLADRAPIAAVRVQVYRRDARHPPFDRLASVVEATTEDVLVREIAEQQHPACAQPADEHCVEEVEVGLGRDVLRLIDDEEVIGWRE